MKNRIDNKIKRIKEWISCRPMETGLKTLLSKAPTLLSKPVGAFVAMSFSRFLGSEGKAIMSTPPNILFLFLLLIILICIYRYFHFEKKKKNSILLGLILFLISFFSSLVRFQLSGILFPIFVGTDVLMVGPSASGGLPDLNEPAPHSPEPVAPEVDQPDGGGPLIPENANPLIPDNLRVRELEEHLSVHMIENKWKPEETPRILTSQTIIEKRVEAALIEDGFPPDVFLHKRKRIRDFMFYPEGTGLTAQTYAHHVKSIEKFGTRDSIPYKRILKAIKNSELSF